MRVRRALRVALPLLICLLAAGGIWLYFWLFHDLPRPEDFGTYVASRHDKSLYVPVSLLDMPPALRWATLATTDSYFYLHGAVEPLSVVRAAWLNLMDDRVSQDGTTLTQGLTANLMAVSGERIDNPKRRRMRELALAVGIIRRYSRDEVLAMYLNTVPYGDGVYGSEAAARHYYGKHVWELDLAECAMLVPISWMRDLDGPEGLRRAEQGQAAVLARMVEKGYITQAEARRAEEEPISLVH